MAVKVELSKTKGYTMLPGFVVIGLIALFFLLSASGVLPVKMKVEPVALVIFSLLLISSAYFIYLTIKKINSKKLGLFADEEGFTYNATNLGCSLGQIKWEDIKTLKSIEGMGNSYIAVEVHNPEAYLKKIKSNFLRKQTEKRVLNSDNHKGVLLTVSANELQDFDFSSLERLFANKLDDYKNKSNVSGTC